MNHLRIPKKYPPCPECDASVTSLRPIVEEGLTHHPLGLGFPITIKDQDWVSGYTLLPCGHRIEPNFTWSLADGYVWPT
jgi:hypothetical protein